MSHAGAEPTSQTKMHVWFGRSSSLNNAILTSRTPRCVKTSYATQHIDTDSQCIRFQFSVLYSYLDPRFKQCPTFTMLSRDFDRLHCKKILRRCYDCYSKVYLIGFLSNSDCDKWKMWGKTFISN